MAQIRARRGEARDHFERMVAEGDRSSGCWLWPYAKNTQGYGVLHDAGRLKKAHRLAFEREYGRLPDVGRHDCDTPTCFNPSHILDGTHMDNNRDMHLRGRARSALGTRHGSSKLTEADIPGIRAALRRGDQPSAIAARLGRGTTTIAAIRDGRTWSHVQDVVDVRSTI